jgi:hypothetical protein
MNIQTFIFNWRGQYEKTKEKIEQLNAIGVQPIIINSDDEHREDGWHNIGEESYFTAQFIKALELFTGDILFHIQADASYINWKQLYEDAEKTFKLTNCGIYAPNVDYTWYNSSRTDIETIRMPNNNLRAVANTDCTCWFIHKDIIQFYKDRNLDFSSYTMGWCWDIVFPALSYMNKRTVVRDYSHVISHPEGTNYNKELAEKEMWDLYNSLPQDIQVAFSYIKSNRYNLVKYFIKP